MFGGRRAGKINEKGGVARSATFHEDERGIPGAHDSDVSKDDPQKTKIMQRSSTITMPLDAQSETGGGSVASSIGSLGSSFKLPFR